MNSREVFRDRGEGRGFTLIEVLLVIALGVLFGAVLIPVGVSSYQREVQSHTREELVNNLRTAQMNAISGKHDSAFGIKIQSDQYVVFEGNAYTSRVPLNDAFFHIPRTISFSGIDEIVFAKLSGTPSITGTIAVVSNSMEGIITIQPGGLIQ